MAEAVCNVAHFPSIRTRSRTSRTSPNRNFTVPAFTDSLHSLQGEPLPTRKPRKSVAFSGDNTIMNENGEISEAAPADESRTTAEKHSTSMLDPIPIAFNLALMATPAPTDPAVDEVTDLFAGLNKKKKKPKKATE